MRTCILVIISVLCFKVQAQQVSPTDAAKKISKSILDQIDVKKDRVRLAFLNFENNSGDVTELGVYLSNITSAELYSVASGKLKLEMVDQSRVGANIDSLKLTKEDLKNVDKLIQLGRTLLVDYVVTGNITDLGSEYNLSTKTYSTITGRIISNTYANFQKTKELEVLHKNIIKTDPNAIAPQKVKDTPPIDHPKPSTTDCTKGEFTIENKTKYKLDVVVFNKDGRVTAFNVLAGESEIIPPIPVGSYSISIHYVSTESYNGMRESENYNIIIKGCEMGKKIIK